MCLYLFIHNKHTEYTHIYYVNKMLILDAINRLTALIIIFADSLLHSKLVICFNALYFPKV